MTGIAEGIELAALIALILLFYIPTVSLIGLIEIGVYRSLAKKARLIAYVLTFIGLTLLTLLLIRIFPYVSFNFLIPFAILLTIILVVNYFKPIRNNK